MKILRIVVKEAVLLDSRMSLDATAHKLEMTACEWGVLVKRKDVPITLVPWSNIREAHCELGGKP